MEIRTGMNGKLFSEKPTSKVSHSLAVSCKVRGENVSFLTQKAEADEALSSWQPPIPSGGPLFHPSADKRALLSFRKSFHGFVSECSVLMIEQKFQTAGSEA